MPASLSSPLASSPIPYASLLRRHSLGLGLSERRRRDVKTRRPLWSMRVAIDRLSDTDGVGELGVGASEETELGEAGEGERTADEKDAEGLRSGDDMDALRLVGVTGRSPKGGGASE